MDHPTLRLVAIEKWEAEHQRLTEEGAALRRDWRRTPWLFAGAGLAVPAMVVFGVRGAIIVLLFVVALVVTFAYLVGTRIKVNESELKEAKETLERLRRGT